MRKIYLSVPFVLAAAGNAFAADVTAPEQSPHVIVSAKKVDTGDFSWDGSYVGVKGNVDVIGKGNASRFFRKPSEVGVYGGHNIQDGQFVYGLEGDVNYLTKLEIAPDGESGSGFYGTARARVGYAAGRFMPYATAGVAAGRLKTVSHDVTETNTRYGYTAGVGVDYAMTDNVNLRVSYDYLKFRGREDDVFSRGVHKAGLGLAIKF